MTNRTQKRIDKLYYAHSRPDNQVNNKVSTHVYTKTGPDNEEEKYGRLETSDTEERVDKIAKRQ